MTVPEDTLRCDIVEIGRRLHARVCRVERRNVSVRLPGDRI
jgi:hypothetical protein